MVKALVKALPDIARLIGRLVIDPRLPRSAKVALVAAAVYLASPIDLLPDVVPFVGYLDDVALAAIVLDGIFNYVDRALVVRYWPGSPAALDKLAHAAHLLARWVPARIKARIFAPR